MKEYRHGGFWRRTVAILIDKAILDVIFLALVVLNLKLTASPYASRPDIPAGFWGEMTGSLLRDHFLLLLLLGMVYFTYFHGSIGQTPGKILLRIKVIRLTGRELTYGTAFLRWLGYLLSGFVFYLGFIWVAFDRKKQGWHDKIAGTLVVHIDDDNERNFGYNSPLA